MSEVKSVVNKILEGADVRVVLAEDAKDDMRAEKLKTQDPKFSAKMSRSITDRAKWNRRLEAIKRICGEDSPQAIAFADANPEMNDNPEVSALEPEVPVDEPAAVPAESKDLVKAVKGLRYKIEKDGDQYTVTCNDNGYSVTETAPGKYTLKHLYSRYEEENLDFDSLIEKLKAQVGNFVYGCGFGITGFVHPGREREAAEYLYEDEMANYYDDAQADDITSIRWDMEGAKQRGTIYIYTTARLKKEALGDLKSFIDGQNSDGLGEGFEQQDFITMRDPGETIVAGNIYKYSGFASSR